jgi:hypothetical protein
MTNEKLNSADKFRFVFLKILDIFTLIFVFLTFNIRIPDLLKKTMFLILILSSIKLVFPFLNWTLILETISYFKLEQKNSTFNDFLYYLFDLKRRNKRSNATRVRCDEEQSV